VVLCVQRELWGIAKIYAFSLLLLSCDQWNCKLTCLLWVALVLASPSRSSKQSLMQSGTSYINLSEGKHWLDWEICFWIAESSKLCVCRCSLAGIEGSNLDEGMHIWLLWLLCVRSIGRSFVQGSPTERVCVCHWVWSDVTVTMYTYKRKLKRSDWERKQDRKISLSSPVVLVLYCFRPKDFCRIVIGYSAAVL
jgi:hypothetical protein